MTASYDPQEWQARRHFVTLITEVCESLSVTVTWLSDQWVARLQKGPATAMVNGYTFPLNNAAVSACLRDKPTAYELLTKAGVPAIPHFLVRLPASRRTTEAIGAVRATCSLPLVLKPAAGESGGFDVYTCITSQEIADVVALLATRHRSLAAGPLVPITREFRTIVLDGEPLLTFEKIRNGNEWRHNLKLGATPHIITDTHVQKLAVQALMVMQGRLAAVDIAETPGGYKIMEINGGIALNHFGAYSGDNRNAALHIYTKIVEASLAATRGAV